MKSKIILSVFVALGYGLIPNLSATQAQANPITYPLLGTACPTVGATISSSFDKYTCKGTSGSSQWSVNQLAYQSPSDYLKGFAIGQQLLKANPTLAGEVVCKATSEGKLVQKGYVQPGTPTASSVTLLNSYYGYMGCWDGITAKLNSKAPVKVSLPEPVYPAGDSVANYQKKTRLQDGSLVQILQDLGGWNATVTSSCGDSSGDGQTQNCLSAISSFEYPDAFDQGIISSCKDSRVQSNWTITSQTWLPQTLQFTPDWIIDNSVDPSTGYGSEYLAATPHTEIAFEVLTRDAYHDDVNGDFVQVTWRHFIYKDGQLYNWMSPCASMDEAAASQKTLEIPVAPVAFKAPSGKVDKTSNAYKTMFNVGKNFAKVSMANDSASSQCSSALKTGMIRNNGIPQYLGVQARMLQSYLQTASGYQGCLDGFGH